MIITVKNHKVRHGDVRSESGISELMGTEKVDIFYSDPPWGQGNLSYWQTINVRQNEGAQKTDVNHSDFLNVIFRLAVKYSKNLVFIEYGQKWREEMITLAKSFNLTPVTVIELLYASGSNKLKCDLHLFSKTPVTIQQPYIDSVFHTSGYETLKRAVSPSLFRTESSLTRVAVWVTQRKPQLITT